MSLPGGGPEILWRPRADARETTNLGRYLTWLAEERGLAFDGYDDLWRWSVTDLDASWSALADHLGVRWHTEPAAALAERRMPGAVWFPGGTLSYAEQVRRLRAGLRRLGVGPGDRVAAYLPNLPETAPRLDVARKAATVSGRLGR